jgi:uncharacterized damage-inducible protein DinB
VKELFKQYASYNLWADERLSEVILTLSEEQVQQTVKSSFPSIHKTLLHMWDAESIWWQRLKLVEHVIRPSTAADYTTNEVTAKIHQQDHDWLQWVSDATDTAIEHVFAYQNTKREQFKQPVFQMLLHLFNHNTYHRGQLVTMFRQVGAEKIPSTDFIEFSRRK